MPISPRYGLLYYGDILMKIEKHMQINQSTFAPELILTIAIPVEVVKIVNTGMSNNLTEQEKIVIQLLETL